MFVSPTLAQPSGKVSPFWCFDLSNNFQVHNSNRSIWALPYYHLSRNQLVKTCFNKNLKNPKEIQQKFTFKNQVYFIAKFEIVKSH